MTTIHLIHGEPAAAALRQALEAREASRCGAAAATAGPAERVVALADDLTVGPLRDIDEAGDPGAKQRAAFWQRLGGVPETLAQDDCASLAAVASSDAHVVVWHTHDAADQLALRRVCYRLRNAPQRLNEVRLAAEELSGPPDAAALRLQARLPDAAPISVLRITRLALEWQEAKFANGETRRWRDNTFTSGTWADLDALILEILGAARPTSATANAPDAASAPWLACGTLGAALVRGGAGFTVGEPAVLWRLRELAAAGELRLREDMCAARASVTETVTATTAHRSGAARPALPHAAAHLSLSR